MKHGDCAQTVGAPLHIMADYPYWRDIIRQLKQKLAPSRTCVTYILQDTNPNCMLIIHSDIGVSQNATDLLICIEASHLFT